MKNTRAAWHKSIFTRLLLIFLLIMVPLYFGGIAVYGWGTAAVQQETSRAISGQCEAWVEDFEREVERIRLLQYECLTDPDLDDLAIRADALGDLQRTQAVNRLLNRLAAIRSSSRYISSVRMYIPAIGRALLSRGSTTELIPMEFERLRQDAGLQVPLVIRDGAAWLSAAYPIQNLSGSRATRVLVAVELSLPEIQKSIFDIGTQGRQTVLSGSLGPVLYPGLDRAVAADMAAGAAAGAQSSMGLAAIRAGGVRYLASRAESEALGVALTLFVPEAELYASLNRYRLWFWLFTVAAVAIITVFTIVSRKLIDRPLAILVQSFRSVESGDLDVRIEHRPDDEFRYLFSRFDEMAANLKALIDQAYKQKILAQRSELKHLQSQINPHFLYNSFFLLQNMVERGDNEGASAFTRQLGAYFRFVTRSESDEVALEQEAAHARAYTQIQARRFRGRIAVEFGDVPDRLRGLPVPRLILQPVVENAFEHGLEQTETGGLLRVSFLAGEGALAIRVEDNGRGVTAQGIAQMNAMLQAEAGNLEGTALVNIHRRLKLRFGDGAGLRFAAGSHGGLLAVLLVPLERKGGGADVQAADC